MGSDHGLHRDEDLGSVPTRHAMTHSNDEAVTTRLEMVESAVVDYGEPPDGGLKAWMVVFGCSCANFIVSGWLNASGVFQDYYSTELFPHLHTSTIAIIPSMMSFLLFAGGPVFGALYDRYGPRWLLAIGGTMHVTGILAASVAGDRFYALVLAQGVCSPIGSSMMLYPSISTLATWFSQRRALALGITAAAASIGSIVFPVMFQGLVERIGFGWTMRACALLIFVFALLANLTVVARIPPRLNPPKFVFKSYLVPFRSRHFQLLSLSMVSYLGLFLPLTYIIVQAEQEGVAEGLADKMLVIVNASSLVGRTIPSWAADYVGRFNMSIIFSFLATITVWAFWIPLHNNTAGIVAFAILYGIFSGGVIALTAVLVGQISDVSENGTWTGTLYGLMGPITLTSTLAAGALVDSQGGSFLGLKILCGASIAIGAGFLSWTRVSIGGWDIRAVV